MRTTKVDPDNPKYQIGDIFRAGITIGLYGNNTIRKGQYIKIVGIEPSVFNIYRGRERDKTYKLILCSKSGKEFKKDFYIFQEGIERIDSPWAMIEKVN